MTEEVEGFEKINHLTVGASVRFKGTIIKSPAKGQVFEMQVSQKEKHEATVYGDCDGTVYPLSKKKHTVEVSHCSDS
jgi:asparaginyl-tRNA synthetase